MNSDPTIFIYWHTCRQVLLVGKDHKEAVLHFVVAENTMELLLGLVDSIAVRGINHEDETLRAGVIVSPERSDLVLPSDVPDVELDILIRHGLHVEANCSKKDQ